MTFTPFLAYEASAGSGKTFNLVVRYLSLLFMGEDPNKILALTFTNKAANEMSERIVLTLKELPSRDELEHIALQSGLSKDEILDKRQSILAEYLNADTKIMTLDKFFAQILRKFSLNAGLMPTFSTFASQHEIKLLIRFLKEVNAANLDNTLISLASLSQKRLGSIIGLLDELYLKSKELPSRKFEKQNLKSIEEAIFTEVLRIKSYMNDCENLSARAQKTFEIANMDDLLAKSWLQKESFEYWDYKKVYAPFLDEHLHHIQSMMGSYMEAKEQNFFHDLFALLDVYERAKLFLAKDESELSFDDITAMVYKLLKEGIDSEFLYFRLDAKIDHILLDEYQDTSVLQYEILKPIISELRAGTGVKEQGSFFFVGDVKQSIYRFRGGVSALFNVTADIFDVQKEALKVNYRSSGQVVNFVNEVFRTKIRDYVDQEVFADSSSGYVEVVADDEILECALGFVKDLLEKGTLSNDIAILCMTNGDGLSIADALRSENIDVVTETTSKLIHQRSVQALIEYLKYCYFNENIYARNFCELSALEYRPIKRVNLNIYTPVALVKQVIEEFGLYHDDINILKFIELLDGYKDIESFIYEYERIDATAYSPELNGVRVLTVHKSKGLEFENVIVLDRLKRAPASRSVLIYEYEGVQLERIFLRQKVRDTFDANYERALAKDKILANEDSLNALYVAFTRAQKNLFIIQKSKDSEFEKLDLKFDSYGSLSVKEQEEVIKVEASALEYRALYYGTQGDLLKVESERESDLGAIDFGLALHYCLEMMISFTLSALPNALMATQNRFSTQLNQVAFDEIEQRIKSLISEQKFQALLEGTIYKERALSYQNELRYIDLLIDQGEQYVVIDYKSSKAHHRAHQKQVSFYKEAVSALSDKKVVAYLCYILSDEIELVQI